MAGPLIDKIAGLTGWKYYLVCWVLGLLGIFGHAPYFIWPITIFVFMIFFRLLTLAETPKQGFRTGLMVGLGYFAGQVYWIGSAFINRGEEFIWLMPFMVGGMALLLAFFWALAGWLSVKDHKNSPTPYLIAAAYIFLAEMIRGHIFGGFPWNLPGYIFKAGSPMSQSAHIYSVYGLSFLVLLVSALLARSIWNKSHKAGFLAAILVLANLGYGMFRLHNAQVQYVEGVKLRLVSAPFSQKDKLDPSQPMYSVEVIQDHINLTASPGLDSITHLVWPEGVLDHDIRMVPELRIAMAETFAASKASPIWILNSARIDDTGDGIDYYNSSSAWSFAGRPEGDILVTADKRKLVPFGEIIPGGKWVEKLGARVISENIGSFTPGSGKNIVDIPGLPRGTIQICYEVIFPGFTARGDSGQGPQWILNQSNDAWFGPDVGPHQHANIARYRSIEHGVPLIRAASNGWSGIIDPYGRYINSVKPGMRQAIDSQLPQALGVNGFHWLFGIHWIYFFLALITLPFVLIGRAR